LLPQGNDYLDIKIRAAEEIKEFYDGLEWSAIG
jgi:hypothetical protein